MADKDNKTEKPTQRRLNMAAKKGQVPQSQELVSAVSLLCLTASCAMAGPWFTAWAKEKIRDGFTCDTMIVENSQAFMSFIQSQITESLIIMAPFLAALTIGGIVSSIAVSGFHFTPNALEIKLNQLNPMSGLQKLFSPESLVKLGLSIVKLTFISIIVWFYLQDKLESLAQLQWVDTAVLLSSMSKLILGVTIRICLGLLVIALIDVFYQKWRYIEKLKMTKQEVRDEFRDQDGPPEIKKKIRQKQFEAAMQRMLQEVPKANVVLVNPDHVAVAIRYDTKKMAAPVVVAKGGDHMCEKIKEIARAYGVPILRRPPLARKLYAEVKLGQAIPESLYSAVAEILALIYRLRKAR